MRLLDSKTARRVRGAGLVLLTGALVMPWALPATSFAVRLTLSAVLCWILTAIVVPLVRLFYKTRRVSGFFWREYRRRTVASTQNVLVVCVFLALLWVFPADSIGARVIEGAVLVLLGLASAQWTIYITNWIWDHRRPNFRLRFGESLLAHPVVEMRDQDGARRAYPDAHSALDWLDVMRSGDVVTFLRLDGGQLQILGPSTGPCAVRCTGGDGSALAEAQALNHENVRNVVLQYLQGDVPGTVTLLTGRATGQAG